MVNPRTNNLKIMQLKQVFANIEKKKKKQEKKV